MKLPKKKLKSITKLKKEAWDYFAEYIKFRDIQGEDSIGWYCYCVTCGKKLYYIYHSLDQKGNNRTNIDCQAGHYIQRKYLNLKFDEQNVHAQCGMTCNKWGLGEPLMYEDAIISKYGINTLERLKEARREYTAGLQVKHDRIYLQEIIDTYKAKSKKLKDKLGNFEFDKSSIGYTALDIPF